jgi:hypothetical protein
VIELALGLLRQELNASLARADASGTDGTEDRVVFPNGDKPDPEFRLGKVTLLLAGIQVEPVLRDADRFCAVAADGTRMRVMPTVRVSLMVLVVAKHSQYDDSLRALSNVISWCQGHPVLDRMSTPQLDPAIDRITLELMSLTLSEQNELWSGLGTGYLPSVLYRMRLLAFTDASGGRDIGTITQSDRMLLRHAG